VTPWPALIFVLVFIVSALLVEADAQEAGKARLDVRLGFHCYQKLLTASGPAFTFDLIFIVVSASARSGRDRCRP
jgi:hypothetical protein